ncbi:Transposon Ty3-I Gag-Pol polyprotein [Araneus ventricosus]|uniref:Transposon Ty3-I Gag-Pol polyprotein n=1 Tax=Araneus ventricosus TaxID=182803 RepID=A0A4Y2KXP0_ARAVE|nr:Transposon Ty3-I Gag-Pol polyprotein [Araneus ventricosus]
MHGTMFFFGKLQNSSDVVTADDVQGILRPSKSPWSSSIHLVEKKDGTWFVFGDLRRLNAVTVLDKYHLPHIQEFSMELNGKTTFSILDVVKAYNQIPVNPADIETTVVTTPIGIFEYNTMPFALRNAGQTFQRLWMTFHVS